MQGACEPPKIGTFGGAMRLPLRFYAENLLFRTFRYCAKFQVYRQSVRPHRFCDGVLFSFYCFMCTKGFYCVSIPYKELYTALLFYGKGYCFALFKFYGGEGYL